MSYNVATQVIFVGDGKEGASAYTSVEKGEKFGGSATFEDQGPDTLWREKNNENIGNMKL